MISLPAPDAIAFFVNGKPAPGGSKSAVPFVKPGLGRSGKPKLGVRVFDNAKFNKQWRTLVAITARGAMGARAPMAGPLCAAFSFWVPRPKDHFRSDGITLHGWAPPVPSVRPDVLKLTRSTEDALTGIVYEDDAQITDEFLVRRYGATPGAFVLVWRFGTRRPTDMPGLPAHVKAALLA